MAREVVWAVPQKALVCTVVHRLSPEPDAYEVCVTADDRVVTVSVFANRAAALKEAERLQRQFLGTQN